MGEVDEVRGTQLYFFIWKSVRKCQTSSELEVDLEVDLEVGNLGTVLTSTFIRCLQYLSSASLVQPVYLLAEVSTRYLLAVQTRAPRVNQSNMYMYIQFFSI